jgi:hypothetical protein
MKISKRTCEHCGCNDDTKKLGEYWVNDDLCSFCATEEAKAVPPLAGDNDEQAHERGS